MVRFDNFFIICTFFKNRHRSATSCSNVHRFVIFPTFLYYRECLNLNCSMGKKCMNFFYGFKSLVKLGVENINFKIPYCRTVFNFSCKTSKNKERFCQFLGTFSSFFHAKFQFFAEVGGIFE